jgi:hypothetical protein
LSTFDTNSCVAALLPFSLREFAVILGQNHCQDRVKATEPHLECLKTGQNAVTFAFEPSLAIAALERARGTPHGCADWLCQVLFKGESVYEDYHRVA